MVHRFTLPLVFIALCSVEIGCGGKSGPDQSLVLPAGWTIADHPHGDLHMSRWDLTTSDDVKAQLVSYVVQGAPTETVNQLEGWKKYILGNGQNSLFLLRTWTKGKYRITRFFSFSNDQDFQHGVASIWLTSADRDFAFSIRKTGMKREPLTDLADKAAEEFAKVN